MEQQHPTKPLKYILYARKSTDEANKQMRSIEDQTTECLEYAQRRNLLVSKTIQEKKSAKRSGKRPLFRQMIRELEQGKYDGILAWHPDRLARNMREAGEIIDMLDEGLIKDIKFVTQEFANDATGKVGLAITFALAKQYSDNLSQNVARGLRHKFAEGRSYYPKHGYLLDENGFYRPDGQHFTLIQRAWQMRKAGAGLRTIVDFLNERGYGKYVKAKKARLTMKREVLSGVFKDSFYYGILTQAGQQVDLLAVDPDFQPMITAQDFLAVQQLSGIKYQPYKFRRRVAFLPLKQLVRCAYCQTHMVAGAARGRTKRYLFYRCDTSYCQRRQQHLKRNIRGKVIFDFIAQLLKRGLGLTEHEYRYYARGMGKVVDAQQAQLQEQLHAKTAYLIETNRQIDNIGRKLLGEQNQTIREVNERHLEQLKQTQQQLKTEVAHLKAQTIDPSVAKIHIRQFLNFSKRAADIVQSADAVGKDKICRLLFLNLDVGETNILSWQLKLPFGEFLKMRLGNNGGRLGT